MVTFQTKTEENNSHITGQSKIVIKKAVRHVLRCCNVNTCGFRGLYWCMAS